MPDPSLSEDLLAIQRRPSMYLGAADPLGLVWEVVANSIDEFMAGRATHIGVTIGADGSVCVEDDGGGLPMEGGRESVAVRALTSWHRTGTLDGHGPHLHIEAWSCGLVVVNALSHWVEVASRANGVDAALRFEAGSLVDGPRAIDAGGVPGTRIAFLPDPRFFTRTLDFEKLRHKLSMLAVLCPGLVIELEDQRVQRARFHAPAGAAGWNEWDERDTVRPEVRFDAVHGEIRVRGTLRWAAQLEHVLGFANLVETNLGSGKNHVGLVHGIRDAVGQLTGAGRPPRDIVTTGLSGIVQVVMENPVLGDPNGRRLDSPEAAEAVHAVVSRAMGAALAEDEALARMFQRRITKGYE